MATRGGSEQYVDVGNVLGAVNNQGQGDESERRSFLTPPPKKKN